MPWNTDDLKRLVELEAHLQHVDPRLALAVVSQESEWNPNASGDNGRSIGLFQLQEAAAKDAGLPPQLRSDVPENIKAGVTYLKQKLTQSGGNVEQALSRYNRGTPDYRGIGDPNYVQNVLRYYPDYKPQGQQPPGIIARVGQALSPASAEAATSQAPPQAAGMSRLQELEAHLARLEGQQAPQATPPLAQPRTPASPQPPAEEPITPERRFLDLPSSQQMSLEDRTQRFKEFYGLRPDLKQEFLRSEEPPSDLVVDIEKPSPTAPRTEEERQARIREELAAWEKQAGRPWREGDPRMPSEKRLGVPDEAPVEEGFTKPSTLVPLIMGLGVPGLTTAAPGMAAAQRLGGKAGPLITRGARAAGEGLSQTLGWGTGRTLETGQVPSPADIGTEAAFNVGAGGLLEGLGWAGQAILRRSQAGKAIGAADEATTAARQTWEQEVTTAKAELQAGRTEAYQAAERRAKAAQAQYQSKVQERDAKIAANQHEYQEAVTAHRAEVQAEQATRYGEARTGAMEETATARAGQQQYQHAIAGQQQAITTARATPGRYTPETPSWVQYEKFGDAAKDAVVDLAPAKAALADVRASRGVLPDGSIRPFPSAVESIAAHLEKATGETSFKTIREELRRLGPLTKSQDGNVRGAAKQLYGIYADVLETSPIANDLLRNANATFRKEMAVQDIADWLKPGHGIVRIDNMGRETINVGTLMTRLEKTVADDSLFRRSFAPDELDALRTDLRQLAGTPTMPRGQMPSAAKPELLPGAAPNVPASMAQAPTAPAVPREVTRPRQELLPGAAPGRRGTEAQRALVAPGAEPPPAVTPREALGERPSVFKDLTKTAMQEYMGSLFGVKPLLITSGTLLWRGGQQLRYGLARGLLSERGRPALLRAMADSPTISPRLHGVMINALSDAERKALLRETREAREKRR